jgi:hypothetical protein
MIVGKIIDIVDLGGIIRNQGRSQELKKKRKATKDHG